MLLIDLKISITLLYDTPCLRSLSEIGTSQILNPLYAALNNISVHKPNFEKITSLNNFKEFLLKALKPL